MEPKLCSEMDGWMDGRSMVRTGFSAGRLTIAKVHRGLNDIQTVYVNVNKQGTTRRKSSLPVVLSAYTINQEKFRQMAALVQGVVDIGDCFLAATGETLSMSRFLATYLWVRGFAFF